MIESERLLPQFLSFPVFPLLILLGPRVFKSHGFIENGVFGRGIQIGHEVSNALELQIFARFFIGSIILYVAFTVHMKRVWVQ